MIPTRDRTTPFTETGTLDPFAAMDCYFAHVQAMEPKLFAEGARFCFYWFTDPTKSLHGVYDAANGEQLDFKAQWEYAWSLDDYLHSVALSKGYALVANDTVVDFLRPYWAINRRRTRGGLEGMSLKEIAYHSMMVGGALGLLSAARKKPGELCIEDWI